MDGWMEVQLAYKKRQAASECFSNFFPSSRRQSAIGNKCRFVGRFWRTVSGRATGFAPAAAPATRSHGGRHGLEKETDGGT